MYNNRQFIPIFWLDEELMKKAGSIDNCDVFIASYGRDDVLLERYRVGVCDSDFVKSLDINDDAALALAVR